MEKFKSELKDLLMKKIGTGIKIEEISVVKMNDEELTGFSFKKAGCDVGPALYVNDAYRAYCDGTPIEEIAGVIVETVGDAFMNVGDVLDSGKEILDDFRRKLRYRLVDVARNKKFLKTVMHRPAGAGLEAVLMLVDDDYNAVVTDNIFEGLKDEHDVDEWEMFGIAFENTLRDVKFGTMWMSMFGDMEDLFDLDEAPGDDDMFVLSNGMRMFGAAVLASVDVRKKVAELIGEYYVLPCSVHEVVCISVSCEAFKADDMIDTLHTMVKSANEMVVRDCDVLSDHVYRVYKNGKIEVAA